MDASKIRRTWAEVNLDHIAHNAQEIRRFTQQNARLMGVVKADAYGHGAPQIARTLLENGFSYLAVSLIEEAVELRQAGIRAPILILSDNALCCAEEIIRYDIRQAVYTYEMAELLSKAAIRLQQKAKIHIKVDTGMGRIGFSSEEAPDAAERISKLHGIEIEGIFTHFAIADEYGAQADAYTQRQYELFTGACEKISGEKHIHIPLRHAANSASILRFPQMHLDMVRAGIILYGSFPSEALKKNCGADLRPAMTLKSAVTYLKEVPAGTSISYGCTYRTARNSVIATVPIGYADGCLRILGNQADAYLEKVQMRVPVVGRVCMDQLMVDVTEAVKLGAVNVGDPVVLFGGQYGKMPTADEIASLAGTIPYEITCAVSRRVPRKYFRGGVLSEVVNRLI